MDAEAPETVVRPSGNQRARKVRAGVSRTEFSARTGQPPPPPRPL